MYGGIAPTSPLTYGLYLRGKDQSGNIVQLIGVNPASGKVQIDPLAVGANFGGNVLLQDPAAYLNWDTIVGALGYGIRGNAGTIEFCNSGGSWAPIAAAAASAGGWTDAGTVVRLDTGTDQVSIGSATPIGANNLSVTGTVAFTGVLTATGGVTVGAAANLTFTSNAGSNRYILASGSAGAIVVQSGAGSASAGGGLLSYGSTHATKAGWVTVGISTGSSGKFSVNDQGLGAGNEIFTVDQTGGVVVNATGAGAMVVNELGADYDFRIESDTNANAFVMDAGVFSGAGAFGFGRLPTTTDFFIVSPPNVTVPANSSYSTIKAGSFNGNITVPTGTAPLVAMLSLAKPDIVATGTVSDAYTVYIADAPTAATRNGALWVAAGQVRFSGMPTAAAGLPAGTLWNNSGVVNIV